VLHVTLPLLLAGALPYLFTLIAKAGAFSRRDNHSTRDWQAKLTGWRQRAHWAHQNSFEIFPLFAAAVIVAHLAAPGNDRATLAAWAFVASRVVYGVCYITDVAALRSLVWFVGVGCIVALFSLGLR
jgi:uncharacterized MAPEG superfamily protein